MGSIYHSPHYYALTEEEAPEIFKTWGDVWSPSMFHARDYHCVCGWRSDALGGGIADLPAQELSTVLRGFSKGGSHNRLGFLGMIVLECPRCFEKFWFHITEYTVYAFEARGVWPIKRNLAVPKPLNRKEKRKAKRAQ